jgi:hypothetical protein
MSIPSTINDNRTLHRAAIPRPLQAALHGSDPAPLGAAFPEALRDAAANLSRPGRPAKFEPPHAAPSLDRLRFHAP